MRLLLHLVREVVSDWPVTDDALMAGLVAQRDLHVLAQQHHEQEARKAQEQADAYTARIRDLSRRVVHGAP